MLFFSPPAVGEEDKACEDSRANVSQKKKKKKKYIHISTSRKIKELVDIS